MTTVTRDEWGVKVFFADEVKSYKKTISRITQFSLQLLLCPCYQVAVQAVQWHDSVQSVMWYNITALLCSVLGVG